MGKRLNKQREEALQPKRLEYAKQEIKKLKLPISFEDKTTLKFTFEGNTITFFAYSGWFSGKGIQDGRGIDNLLKQLKNAKD